LGGGKQFTRIAVMVMHYNALERSARSRDPDDDDRENSYRRPVTLPRLEWDSAISFQLFTRIWRVSKYRGLDGADVSGDKPPSLPTASRTALARSTRLQTEKPPVVARRSEGETSRVAESEPGENPRDLVEIFAKT
jgi:hypothetical protein